ncbi:MAG: DIP1984 family protein [Desulfovibrio sp.]|nr:DIP1984 family protein [Desulfovibrio sp.]
MKLAQALQERADIQKRLSQLRQRLCYNARVQEGEEPQERPEDLLQELDALTTRQEDLIARINHTNAQTIDDGVSLTELLAKRDVLTTKVHILREFLEAASDITSRALRSEIKIKSTIAVAKERARLDKLSQSLRELDARIQQKNWTTELR